MRRLVLIGSLVGWSTVIACTSNEGEPPAATPAKAETPPVGPEPEPEPEPSVHLAIASVQMLQDCTDLEGSVRPPPPAGGYAPRKPMPPSQRSMVAGRSTGSRPIRQPCTQSTMQVVFSEQGTATSPVEIQAVTLIDPKSGKALARLQARDPAAWRDGAYQSWDQVLEPNVEVKTSYALSVPQWADVEAALGTSSYGIMFALELEVKVGNARQTVRSPEFPRERPHVIST